VSLGTRKPAADHLDGRQRAQAFQPQPLAPAGSGEREGLLEAIGGDLRRAVSELGRAEKLKRDRAPDPVARAFAGLAAPDRRLGRDPGRGDVVCRMGAKQRSQPALPPAGAVKRLQPVSRPFDQTCRVDRYRSVP